MKDYCLALVAAQSNQNSKLNIMREYLQAYILRILHQNGFFRTNAFVGGTALRFIYALPRFSEDLDFSTTNPLVFRLKELITQIKTDLKLAGYQVTATCNDNKTVYSAFIQFEDLLYQTGITPLKGQKISIKLEIDTRAPAGAVKKPAMMNKFFPLTFLSYDISSLFAGKVHAILSRKHLEGRDYFDLAWYLTKWPSISPNFEMLQNALKQTNWRGPALQESNWRERLHEVVQKANWVSIKRDVELLLERSSDLEIFSQENILELLEKE